MHKSLKPNVFNTEWNIALYLLPLIFAEFAFANCCCVSRGWISGPYANINRLSSSIYMSLLWEIHVICLCYSMLSTYIVRTYFFTFLMVAAAVICYRLNIFIIFVYFSMVMLLKNYAKAKRVTVMEYILCWKCLLSLWVLRW